MMKKIKMLAVLIFVVLGVGFFPVNQAEAVNSPTNFRAESNSVCSIDLSWQYAKDTSSYRFEYQRSTDSTFPIGFQTRTCYEPPLGTNTDSCGGSGNFNWLNGTSFNNFASPEIVKQLNHNTKYYVRVKVIETQSAQADSSITTNNLPTVLEPDNVKSVASLDGDNQHIDIFFGDSDTDNKLPLNGYVLYRAENDGDFEFINVVQKDNPNRDPNINLNINSVWRYKIFAYQTDNTCGNNANTNNPSDVSDNIAFSPASAVVVIPKPPSSLSGGLTTNGINLSWTNPQGNDSGSKIEIQRSVQSDFDSVTSIPIETDATSFTDSVDVGISATYFYRVRICAITPDGSGNQCSIFSNNIPVNVGEPRESRVSLKTGISNVNTFNRKASVYLSWIDKFSEGQSYEGERSENMNFTSAVSLGTVPASGGWEMRDNGADLGKIYYYRIKAKLNATDFLYSNKEEVNLKIAPVFSGFAYSNVDGHGIGWVKFKDTGAYPYSVQVDNEGLMSGYAWSSNGGWLSFNKGDLVGCPEEPCEARIAISPTDFSNSSNPYLRPANGWAKFIAADESQGAWTGWVHLREDNVQTVGVINNIKNFGSEIKKGNIFSAFRQLIKSVRAVTQFSYGLRYDLFKNKFVSDPDETTNLAYNSWAWGGDVTGWMRFDEGMRSGCADCGVSGNNAPVSIEIAPDNARVGTNSALELNSIVKFGGATAGVDQTAYWSVDKSYVVLYRANPSGEPFLEEEARCGELTSGCGYFLRGEGTSTVYQPPTFLPPDILEMDVRVIAISKEYPLVLATSTIRVACPSYEIDGVTKSVCIRLDPSVVNVQPTADKSADVKTSEEIQATVYIGGVKDDAVGVQWTLQRNGAAVGDIGKLINEAKFSITYSAPQNTPSWAVVPLDPLTPQVFISARIANTDASSSISVFIGGKAGTVERRIKEVNP